MTAGAIDEPRGVREGEELPVDRVDAFLKERVPGLEGTPEIRQYPGGASNLTYLVQYANKDLVLRRPPFGHKAKSAHDMLREARIQQALAPVYPYVPKIVALCDDASVLGCDFYVMERIRGVIPRRDLPKDLNLDAAATRALCLSVLDRLVELHQVDVHAAGLDSLGKGEGYVRRQVEGWSDRYRRARTEDVPAYEVVIAWLAEKQPKEDSGSCLIHNDFRFDNVVLDPENPQRVIGVLDWEMATLGDPLMDLGGALAYWVEATDDPVFQKLRRQPTNAPGMLTRAEVLSYYGEKTGREIPAFDFYLVFGLFRLAGIAQQIYFRFVAGQTKNPEFGAFGGIVTYLEKRCLGLIAQSAL